MPGFVQGTFYEFLRDRAPPIGEIDHRDLEALDCGREEMNEPSLKVFELSHTLRDKWVTGEPDVRSRFLELVCLNWQLVDGELVYEIRKPFDVLAEGLNSAKSRGERTSVELFVVGLSELVATIDAIEYYLIRPRVNLRHRARRSRAHSDTQGHELTAHDAER